MTGTDIRDALTEVSHALPVPAPDRLAFERLVRAERGRRRTRGALALSAVAAVVALVGGLVVAGLPSDGSSPSGPPVAHATNEAVDVPLGPVPVILNGELGWVMGDEVILSNGQRAARVLGSAGSNGALVLDAANRVWFERVATTGGQPVRFPRALGEPVRDAVVDRTGAWLTYVDGDGDVHVRRTDEDFDWSSSTWPDGPGIDGRLVAGDGGGWLLLRDGQVSAVNDGGSKVLDVHEDALGGELGGDTVAVKTQGGASFFDRGSGEPRQLDLGGAVGGLSSTGEWYATAASVEQRDNGMSPDLDLIDTRTGTMHSVGGYDASQQALSVWWQGDNRFLVLARAGNGDHVLWDCYVSRDDCAERFTDTSGTLAIPGQ